MINQVMRVFLKKIESIQYNAAIEITDVIREHHS